MYNYSVKGPILRNKEILLYDLLSEPTTRRLLIFIRMKLII